MTYDHDVYEYRRAKVRIADLEQEVERLRAERAALLKAAQRVLDVTDGISNEAWGDLYAAFKSCVEP